MTGQAAYRGWMALLIALMGLGFAAWLYQLSNGLTVTGMNNVVSWGLYTSPSCTSWACPPAV